MKFLLFLALSLVCLSPLRAVAQEAESGSTVLAAVDRAATGAKDFTATVELVTVDAKGKKTERTMTVWQLGADKRMVKLSAPARLRGVGLLATDHEQLYVHLPSFGRVRRVSGRKRGEPFLGSNFTQDDMVRTGYGSRFAASLAGQTESHWTLRLDPKSPADEPAHHVVLHVRKEDHLVERVEMFRSESELAKRLVAADFKQVGSIKLAHRIVAEDVADGSKSTATLTDVKVDTGLEPSFFSKRQLKRKP